MAIKLPKRRPRNFRNSFQIWLINHKMFMKELHEASGHTSHFLLDNWRVSNESIGRGLLNASAVFDLELLYFISISPDAKICLTKLFRLCISFAPLVIHCHYRDSSAPFWYLCWSRWFGSLHCSWRSHQNSFFMYVHMYIVTHSIPELKHFILKIL